jgi:Ca2+-binding EF-hand superfamily protein
VLNGTAYKVQVIDIDDEEGLVLDATEYQSLFQKLDADSDGFATSRDLISWCASVCRLPGYDQ